MVSFVHPGKNSLVSFDPGVVCPTFKQFAVATEYMKPPFCGIPFHIYSYCDVDNLKTIKVLYFVRTCDE